MIWRVGAQAGRLEPLEVTETVPRLGTARLGVFRDYEALDRTWAIWMRRDWQTRRWVAGDGKGPIPVNEAPELPPGAFRRAVTGDDSLKPPDRRGVNRQR